jgi:hypothetical protein
MKGTIFVGLAVCFLVFYSLFTPHTVFAGNPPDQGKSTITSTAAPADGSSPSTVTIVLKDAGGNTLTSNDSINITSSDSTASFNPSSLTLDGSGTITTQMKTTTVGSVPITITDTSASNTQLTWSVLFYQPGSATPTPTPTPNPNACTDAAPGSSLQLTSAQSSGAHSITLTWADASNPVTYYLLSYGLSSSHYIYGVPNMGGQGTTSFIVGGLATGTKYFFVIRAVNGCMPGSDSNEVSAVAGVASTPTPGPADTSTDTSQSDLVPTDTPELSTDTPTPSPTEVITPVPASATGGSNSSIGYIMIGATALGVVCAGIGAFLLLRMNRRHF